MEAGSLVWGVAKVQCLGLWKLSLDSFVSQNCSSEVFKQGDYSLPNSMVNVALELFNVEVPPLQTPCLTQCCDVAGDSLHASP